MNTPKKLATISLGAVVRHCDEAAMKTQSGLVVEDAGTKYGRHYVWVAWIEPETQEVRKTAFWDDKLINFNESTHSFLERTAKSTS